MFRRRSASKSAPAKPPSSTEPASASNQPKGKSGGEMALDATQTLLDLVGLIPGFGEAADGVNGLIHLARGNSADAALSFAAMVPVVGSLGTGGKLLRRGLKLADTAKDGQKVVEGGSKGLKHIDDLVPSKGRGKNKLKPIKEAGGNHTVFRRNKDGIIDKYQEFNKNPNNPKTGFDPGRRFDGQKGGAPHTNKKTGKSHPTPHVNDKQVPGGVRDPEPWELPKGY